VQGAAVVGGEGRGEVEAVTPISGRHESDAAIVVVIHEPDARELVSALRVPAVVVGVEHVVTALAGLGAHCVEQVNEESFGYSVIVQIFVGAEVTSQLEPKQFVVVLVILVMVSVVDLIMVVPLSTAAVAVALGVVLTAAEAPVVGAMVTAIAVMVVMVTVLVVMVIITTAWVVTGTPCRIMR